jgi:hypothetical protein
MNYNINSISILTLTEISKKSPHFLQNKYKKQHKSKRWWLLTSKIQAFRISHKKYKPTIFNIPSLVSDLSPNILDFITGPKEYHKLHFNQCINQLDRITIQKTIQPRIPRYIQYTLDTLLDTYYIDHIDIWNFVKLFTGCKPRYIQSKQLYPNHLFKNIHYKNLNLVYVNKY